MNTSSALDPQSPQAHVIGGVGVISTIIFVLIFIIVTGAIVYALTFLPLLSAVGLAGAYGFYAAAAAISLTFVWAAVRETKGKTLETNEGHDGSQSVFGFSEENAGIARHDHYGTKGS